MEQLEITVCRLTTKSTDYKGVPQIKPANCQLIKTSNK